jgi:conjugative transfer signal peptidase TraF
MTLIAVVGFVGIGPNETESLPLGLYVKTRDINAPLVAFCPTGTAAIDSIAGGYRPHGMQCHDGYAPLLKPVAARPGDIVDVTERGISVNGKVLANTKAFTVDGKKRPMHVWPLGQYTVAPGTLWVLSTYNKYSYDSRYFGPIQFSTVITHVKPLWVRR